MKKKRKEYSFVYKCEMCGMKSEVLNAFADDEIKGKFVCWSCYYQNKGVYTQWKRQ